MKTYQNNLPHPSIRYDLIEKQGMFGLRDIYILRDIHTMYGVSPSTVEILPYQIAEVSCNKYDSVVYTREEYIKYYQPINRTHCKRADSIAEKGILVECPSHCNYDYANNRCLPQLNTICGNVDLIYDTNSLSGCPHGYKQLIHTTDFGLFVTCGPRWYYEETPKKYYL
jgi:hypothetical protein